MAEQKEKKLKEEDLKLLEESKKKREETQRYRFFLILFVKMFNFFTLLPISRKQIQEALNQQTYPHFKAYSEQQHPNNVQAVSF